jgi:hypothetical protein
MSTEFTREDRYIVFKLSDVERYLTDADRAHLAMMKNEIDAGRDCANKPPFKGLIVESDWPEYEPTWEAIEARVTGALPAQRMNMQTADQVTQAFKAELQALLDKYGAELSARDTWEGYPECGEDVRMQVNVPAIYDADHNCLREYTEIDLGSWVRSTQAMPKEAKP